MKPLRCKLVGISKSTSNNVSKLSILITLMKFPLAKFLTDRPSNSFLLAGIWTRGSRHEYTHTHTYIHTDTLFDKENIAAEKKNSRSVSENRNGSDAFVY